MGKNRTKKINKIEWKHDDKYCVRHSHVISSNRSARLSVSLRESFFVLFFRWIALKNDSLIKL